MSFPSDVKGPGRRCKKADSNVGAVLARSRKGLEKLKNLDPNHGLLGHVAGAKDNVGRCCPFLAFALLFIIAGVSGQARADWFAEVVRYYGLTEEQLKLSRDGNYALDNKDHAAREAKRLCVAIQHKLGAPANWLVMNGGNIKHIVAAIIALNEMGDLDRVETIARSCKSLPAFRAALEREVRGGGAGQQTYAEHFHNLDDEKMADLSRDDVAAEILQNAPSGFAEMAAPKAGYRAHWCNFCRKTYVCKIRYRARVEGSRVVENVMLPGNHSCPTKGITYSCARGERCPSLEECMKWSEEMRGTRGGQADNKNRAFVREAEGPGTLAGARAAAARMTQEKRVKYVAHLCKRSDCPNPYFVKEVGKYPKHKCVSQKGKPGEPGFVTQKISVCAGRNASSSGGGPFCKGECAREA
mmetsp:Transcript_29071/g.89978  ORF Transcript_29071/g.89978 Transcript_29071/m.89978 type:complete len:413 (+) Transcript_29071:733-1971(+)